MATLAQLKVTLDRLEKELAGWTVPTDLKSPPGAVKALVDRARKLANDLDARIEAIQQAAEDVDDVVASMETLKEQLENAADDLEAED